MKIDLQLIRDILYKDGRLAWDDASMQGIAESYAFLEHFSNEKVIYGINTGFGPMAQYRVSDEHQRQLQITLTSDGRKVDLDQSAIIRKLKQRKAGE